MIKMAAIGHVTLPVGPGQTWKTWTPAINNPTFYLCRFQKLVLDVALYGIDFSLMTMFWRDSFRRYIWDFYIFYIYPSDLDSFLSVSQMFY